MSYLADTNVLSEMRKSPCDALFFDFMKTISLDDLYISVFTLGEIRQGINRLSPGRKKTDLIHWYDTQLLERFREKIIPVDIAVIEEWSGLVSHHHRTLPLIDSLLAATCLTHNLTLLTRNSKDFQDIPNLKLTNPWNPQ